MCKDYREKVRLKFYGNYSDFYKKKFKVIYQCLPIFLFPACINIFKCVLAFFLNVAIYLKIKNIDETIVRTLTGFIKTKAEIPSCTMSNGD